jgi:hypothetical protein
MNFSLYTRNWRAFWNTNARILKAHSHALIEWKFNLSFSRVSLLFLNSWRVSVVPSYVTTHPPAIQKQHSHSREAQIEPPRIECEWAFRILFGTSYWKTANFPRLYYPHFATKLWNITNFVMLFQAVMKFLSRLVEIKILSITQVVNYRSSYAGYAYMAM